MRLWLCLSIGLALFLATAANAANAIDSSWLPSDIAKIKRLSIPAADPLTASAQFSDHLAAPPSPSNRVADNSDAAALGERLFFDPALSSSGELACASCHNPAQGFSDALSMARGKNLTTRNTPTLIGSANDKWWFWDGRSDSLWSQALLPFEAPDEMDSSRVHVVQRVISDPDYRASYRRVFGDWPFDTVSANAAAAARVSSVNRETILQADPSANPAGNLAQRTQWYRMPASEREAITAVFVNVGKAIAAYERTLLHRPARFDHFARQLISTAQGKPKQAPVTITSDWLNEQEIQGLRLYLDDNKTHCRNCHNGPRFSNSEFYDVGTGRLTGRHLDLGRSLGLAALRASEFNCLGPHSDVPPAHRKHRCRLADVHTANNSPFMLGAFKTPTLRELIYTAPYFHDGRMESLEDVMQHYLAMPDIQQQLQRELDPAVFAKKQESPLPPLSLTSDEASALTAFLRSLSAEYPTP